MKKVRRGCTLRILLVLLGLRLLVELPNEPARWQLAAALESYLDNDLPRAATYIDRAIEWEPENTELLSLRAQWRLRLGDAEQALVDIDRAIEIANESEPSASQLPTFSNPRIMRTEILLVLSRGQEAIEIYDDLIANWEELMAADQPGRWLLSQSGLSRWVRNGLYQNLLNGRAYARARAQLDVSKGLDDIDAAFAIPVYGGDPEGNEFRYELVDTRGYLRLLDGDLRRAREDMETAVELGRLGLRQLDLIRVRPSSPVDRRSLEESIRRRRESMAVVYHHRSLVYQALGETQKAESDRRKAVELGFSPEHGVW